MRGRQVREKEKSCSLFCSVSRGNKEGKGREEEVVFLSKLDSDMLKQRDR